MLLNQSKQPKKRTNTSLTELKKRRLQAGGRKRHAEAKKREPRERYREKEKYIKTLNNFITKSLKDPSILETEKERRAKALEELQLKNWLKNSKKSSVIPEEKEEEFDTCFVLKKLKKPAFFFAFGKTAIFNNLSVYRGCENQSFWIRL